MNLLLDTGILGFLCHPNTEISRPIGDWFNAITFGQSVEYRLFVPEICDYELRRKLLHLVSRGQSTVRSIQRLDELGMLCDYLSLDTETMRIAAEIWCQARQKGMASAPDSSLDADVILAAQAMTIGGTIVTTNRKHLARFIPAKEWTEIEVSPNQDG